MIDARRYHRSVRCREFQSSEEKLPTTLELVNRLSNDRCDLVVSKGESTKKKNIYIYNGISSLAKICILRL